MISRVQPKLIDRSLILYEWRSLLKASPLAYLVGFYLVAFYLELHLRHPILAEIRFQFLFGALIGSMCLFKTITQQTRLPISSATKAAIALIAIMGIYTIYTYDPETSSRVYNDRVLKFAAISLFIYCAVDKIEDLRVIIFALFLVWLKLAQEGIFGWVTGNLVWDNQGIPRLHGSTTMFRHPNSLSGFAVSCLPFCVFFYYGFKSQIMRAGIIFLAATCLFMIMTTGSRTGYVALVLSFIALIFLLKKYRTHAIFIGIVATIIASIYVPMDYQERFDSIFTGEEREGRSSEARLQILEDAIKVFQDHPMGVGVGAFPAVREDMFGRVQDTHNLYFEVLTNIGVIGFLIFVIFIICLVKTTWTFFKLVEKTQLRDIDQNFIRSTLTFVMGYIAVRLFLGLFGMDMYEIYWWLALGLTLACSKLIYLNAKEPLFKTKRLN